MPYKDDGKKITRKQLDFKPDAVYLELTYTVKDSDLDEEEEPAEEESKDASDSSQRQAYVSVKIRKAGDGVHVVEWKLKEGDRELFFEHFDLITDDEHIRNFVESSKAF